jgi:hypothetical protein
VIRRAPNHGHGLSLAFFIHSCQDTLAQFLPKSISIIDKLKTFIFFTLNMDFV